MPEAITKYALNSTLGTDEFQPLDKMIVGQKMFVASDTPIFVSEKSVSTNANAYTTFLTFTPKLDGQVKISLFLEAWGGSDPIGNFFIQENGKMVYSYYTKTSKNVETIIKISAKKTYKFLCAPSPGANVLIKDFTISGSIVDNNWFKIESYEIE